jgi:carnitine O-acetyltransferase
MTVSTLNPADHSVPVLELISFLDRLQYTITSRKEMPNAPFCEEIAKAAEDLYQLHADINLKSRL